MADDQTPPSPQATAAEPDPDLLRHIEALGLKTTDDYIAWCARHGFSRRTDKDWRQRLKERSFVHRPVADARLAQQRHEARNPERVIERIFLEELQEDAVLQPSLKAIYRAYQSAADCPQTSAALLRLLRHVGRHGDDLFGTQPVVPQFGRQEGNTFVGGLLALARHSAGWVRLVAAWEPHTHNPRRQLASLARHLLAHWPVPPFMDSAWFRGDSADAVRQRRWFRHLGDGQNIRTADLPLPYTRRMAHHFMQAPPDLTVEAALRWGQIHALGGDGRLVRAVIGTRLGTEFGEDAFWTTVLRFFIANPALVPAQVGPIIDYIHQQRFVPQAVLLAPGVVGRGGPPQPAFTVKGRTPASLLRQVACWHGDLAHARQPQAEWPPSGIAGLEFRERVGGEGAPRVWTVRELTSTKALVAEGREMRHCVATYAHECLAGVCSIWTLEVEGAHGRSKVLTVEVRSAARLIWQVRGRCNTRPGLKHLGILRRWAEQSGLRLADHV
jgi:hypothetical protein